MKTYNVRSRQWRRHYRRIGCLDSRAFREHFEQLEKRGASAGRSHGARVIITEGIIRHNNKMLVNGRQFWLPL